MDGIFRPGLLIQRGLACEHPLVPVAGQVATVLMAELHPLPLGWRLECHLGGDGATHEVRVHRLDPSRQVLGVNVGQGAQCLEDRVEPACLQRWQRIVLG